MENIITLEVKPDIVSKVDAVKTIAKSFIIRENNGNIDITNTLGQLNTSQGYVDEMTTLGILKMLIQSIILSETVNSEINLTTIKTEQTPVLSVKPISKEKSQRIDEEERIDRLFAFMKNYTIQDPKHSIKSTDLRLLFNEKYQMKETHISFARLMENYTKDTDITKKPKGDGTYYIGIKFVKFPIDQEKE